MDLISREAIKKYISAPCTYVEGKRIFYEEDLDLIGSPFEGMTNGEVLKSIFPSAELLLGNSDYLPNVFSVKEEWWNAPYQKGGKC